MPSELLMIYFVCGDFKLSNPVGYGFFSGDWGRMITFVLFAQ